MKRLTAQLDAECVFHGLDRTASRMSNMRTLWSKLSAEDWDLVYQEGTGIAGGLTLIRAARSWGQRYVVSSGDPVGGFFRTTKGPVWGALFEQYERTLYRHAEGFVGWTPYLTGMAMKMGAPRAVTVEGAVDLDIFHPYTEAKCRALKSRYGLNPDHLVCGTVGSLKWTPRQSYCYGLELIGMLPYLQRDDVSVLIVGDGDGRTILEGRVPPSWTDRVVFTGRVPEDEVVDTLNAMDVGFIAQTLDGLGRYRLTTKLPEYLAAGLPVAMSPIPGYYDYVLDAGWALPAHHPASPDFHRGIAHWINRLSWDDVRSRAQAAPQRAAQHFSYEVVRPRFEAFINELIAPSPTPSTSTSPALQTEESIR